MATKKKASSNLFEMPEDRTLNWYGLPDLGDKVICIEDFPLTGNWLTDQLSIEFLCFRIGMKVEEGGLDKFGHFKRIVDLLWNNPEINSPKKFTWNSWADRMLRKMCEENELCIAGSASAGKSDPAALWVVVNYMADPTHTMCLMMSTTISGAKRRIWKTLREYVSAIPSFPGKQLWSSNEIKGLSYDCTSYGDSSGIFLLATEQSSEKTAMDKLIGVKAPRTGNPNDSYEALAQRPEFSDLVKRHDEDYLQDLLPRLQCLLEDRIGKIIMAIDEATGCSESIWSAYTTNIKPGNDGHVQCILLGNPNSYYDTFGIASTPDDGWKNVTINDEEWRTKTGGLVARFNGEKNPRIAEKNESYSWMQTKEAIKELERNYGRNSLFFSRMVSAWWIAESSDSGIYTQADIEFSGSTGKTLWGFRKPFTIAALDPSFTAGGDRASCTYGLFGQDIEGRWVLEVIEEIPIKVNISDTNTPVSFQMVRQWKTENQRRGVTPENAVFDSTGGGITFADIVKAHYSASVLAVSSAGKASTTALSSERNPQTGERSKACDRYANRATEIWCGAHPLFRSGQIRGVTTELAKELVSRQYDKNTTGDARVLKIESKRVYKAREGGSPDRSDSFLLLVELAKQRHGFKSAEQAAQPTATRSSDPSKPTTWNAFVQRARRLSHRQPLQ